MCSAPLTGQPCYVSQELSLASWQAFTSGRDDPCAQLRQGSETGHWQSIKPVNDNKMVATDGQVSQELAKAFPYR